MRKAVVFFSGGIDSWVHLIWAIQKFGRDNVTATYLDFGHKYRDKEIRAATLLTQYLRMELQILPVQWLGKFEDPKNAHIPLRNIFVLLMGVLEYASTADELYLVFGMLHHESSEDKNEVFMRRMNTLIASQFEANMYHPVNKKVQVICPFSNYTKSELIKWYLDESWLSSMLLATIGCYNAYPNTTFMQCGTCVSCFNRWVALTNNYITETYHFGAPYDWAIEQLFNLADEKSEKAKFSKSLRQLWFKRKWIKEVLSAYKILLRNELDKEWAKEQQCGRSVWMLVFRTWRELKKRRSEER